MYILGFLQLVIFTQFYHQNHQGVLLYARLCYICTLSMLVQSLTLTRKVAIRRIDGRREIFISISPSVSFADSSLIRWSQRTLNTYRISMYLYLKYSDRLGNSRITEQTKTSKIRRKIAENQFPLLFGYFSIIEHSHWRIIWMRLKISAFGYFMFVVLERRKHSFVLRT